VFRAAILRVIGGVPLGSILLITAKVLLRAWRDEGNSRSPFN